MFRQVASRLLTRPTTTYSAAAAASTRRPFSITEVADTAPGDEAFVEAWKKVVPNIDPPNTPIQYMHPRPPTPSTLPTKLTVNFVLPYASELSKKEVVHQQTSMQMIASKFLIPWLSRSKSMKLLGEGGLESVNPFQFAQVNPFQFAQDNSVLCM